MSDIAILQQLGMIIAGAAILALAAQTLRIPSIVGYILAGLVLGPLLGLIEVGGTLDIVAEVGIILLLFLVGLELSLEKIRDVGKVAVLAGVSQIVLTGLSVAAISFLFGRSPGEILFFGIALTFSSTVVVVKLLDRLRALDAPHGRVAVGILLIQDLVVVLVLTIVSGLSGGEELETAALVRDLGLAFAGTGVLLLGAIVAARWVLPPLFRWIEGSPETELIWSLSWCFILVLAAYYMNLSVELGAFVAGVTIAQLPQAHDLRRRVHPLTNLFVAVFFVTLGLQMELGAAVDAWPFVLALTVFSLLVKPPLIAHLVRAFGRGPRLAMRSGVTLGQTSEFSLILATLALGNQLIGPDVLSIVAAVALLTMGISSLSVSNGSKVVDWIIAKGLLRVMAGADWDSETEPTESSERPAPPIIVIGMNALGRGIVNRLTDLGESVVAVDTDPAKLRGLSARTLVGNAEYQTVLEETGLPDARLIVSTLQIEDVNRLIAFQAESFGVPAVIHAFSDRSTTAPEDSVRFLLDSRDAGIREMTERIRDFGGFRP